MGTKMTPTYVTLILAYLQENLYEIKGKNTAITQKENLLSYGKYI